MRFGSRVAAVGAALTLAGGAAVSTATPAAASDNATTTMSSFSSLSSFTCDAWRYERGSRGHGASVTCHGSSFTGYAVCHQPNGDWYIRFGNRAPSGGTSIMWCDRNAEVADAGAFPI
ncbi:hypothetical protein [Streptomyces sp. NPDC046261]|uniref:hypothetical protein n=1 Tax=Streptomyces sp. NPDC046261 TaxID=3157200 RepID=UPI0033F5FE25